MEIVRLGESVHGSDFRVLRENGYPVYLLLLVETPALFEVDGEWVRVEADTAFLFRPGQRHSYRAQGGEYADCWAHIGSAVPLLFEGFPFGRPVPLRGKERFYSLFRILSGEFFAARRTRESVLDALASALLGMLAAEVGVGAGGELFYPLLALREEIFRSPAAQWRADEAAVRIGVSTGYFHVLYKKYFHTTFLADAIASRVQAAEELLLSGGESVERIAERCGYLNVENFIRQFRRATGMTPLAFRKRGKCTGGERLGTDE